MNCLDRFGDEMKQLIDKYKAVVNSVFELVRQTWIMLEEDIYFAGLLYSNCEKYRYGGGFVGICGDRLFEVVNISYREERSNYPLHNALVNNYYSKLPAISYAKMSLLERDKTMIGIRTFYPMRGGENVYVVTPRESLDDIAKKFHIPSPGLRINLESMYVAIELSIDKYRFAIIHNGYKAYLEGKYPQGFENSPAACAITDAVVRITTNALNLYEDITNKGMKFASIFLLY